MAAITPPRAKKPQKKTGKQNAHSTREPFLINHPKPIGPSNPRGLVVYIYA